MHMNFHIHTGYIPECPPGSLDHCTLELRHCVSVLFMFERKPHRDKQFSIDCRHWLDLMVCLIVELHIYPVFYYQDICSQ